MADLGTRNDRDPAEAWRIYVQGVAHFSPRTGPETYPDGRCLWCDQTFSPRTTGGSGQKFCCTGHRQQFWVAARRWTMRAIDAGLLSVDCLKASHTSVHAA
jgi:hypothetical protein